jgi:excisionase family DNA binding protein
MIDMASELLTLEEVAKKLKISKYTVIRLIHNGKLEYIMIGSRYRVSLEALERYITNNTRLEEDKK